MNSEIKQFFSHKSSLILSGSVLLSAYFTWSSLQTYTWLRWLQPWMVNTKVKGCKTCSDSVTYTHAYYIQLLRSISKLFAENKTPEPGQVVDCVLERVGDCPTWEQLLLRFPPFAGSRFYYRNTPFWLWRGEENLELYTWAWNRQTMDALLDEVLQILKKDRVTNLIAFYHLTKTLDWDKMGSSVKKRSLESVILREGVKEGLIRDVREFLAHKGWYLERGVPYRRGYLLYGPPGTGKTSVITAIAGEVKYDICILSLTSPDLTDDGLTLAVNKVHSDSILLIEDIDAVFKNREYGDGGNVVDGASTAKITFKGILNALDGVASQQGRILFITTNHIKKLDGALIRPGRVDVKVLIDHASDAQMLKMFTRFYPQLQDMDEDELVDKMEKVLKRLNKKTSMACAQSLFVLHKNDPKAGVEAATKYFKDYDENNCADLPEYYRNLFV